MSKQSSSRGGGGSPTHRARQKRLVRHAIASGEDLPPVGYADGSSYFKTGAGATDEQAYWSGPVTERPQPWLQPRQQPQRQQEWQGGCGCRCW